MNEYIMNPHLIKIPYIWRLGLLIKHILYKVNQLTYNERNKYTVKNEWHKTKINNSDIT